MLTSELSELAAVVERIRATVHPSLDRAFVEKVLQAEADAAGQDAAALQGIRAAVDAALRAPAA